jgi:hypothetical protein
MAMEQLWSREDPARQNAGKDYNFPVAPGTFVTSASFAIQVSRAPALVNSDTIGGGFAHRLEWSVVWRPGRPRPTVYSMDQIAPLDWQVPEGTGVDRSPEMERAVSDMIFTRWEKFQPADDMDGHLPARMAKLTLLVAAADGRRIGEIGDWEIAQEIVRCSGAIREWLLSRLADQKMDEAKERGREDYARDAAKGAARAKATANENRLLDRLRVHRFGGPHPGECPTACLEQLFNSKNRVAGREALTAIRTKGWAEIVPVEGRKTAIYALTDLGEVEWKRRRDDEGWN